MPVELKLENCDLAYEKSSPIIKGVGFSAKSGEMIAIMGKSGVGKSSLLKLFFGDIACVNGKFKIFKCAKEVKKPYIKQKIISKRSSFSFFERKNI